MCDIDATPYEIPGDRADYHNSVNFSNTWGIRTALGEDNSPQPTPLGGWPKMPS
jgi:hypothetical protein